MIQASYLYAKKVFHKQIDRTSATNCLNREVGMNQGSANDYIGVFCSMMEGNGYKRTINAEATRYYLESIYRDYGVSQLQKALLAVRTHTIYYGKLGRGNLKNIEKIVEEFKV